MTASKASRSSLVGERPEAAVDGRASRIERDDAEQVLTSAFSGERIALEVQEDVAGRRLGQAQQPLLLLELPQLVNGGILPRDSNWTRACSWTRT